MRKVHDVSSIRVTPCPAAPAEPQFVPTDGVRDWSPWHYRRQPDEENELLGSRMLQIPTDGRGLTTTLGALEQIHDTSCLIRVRRDLDGNTAALPCGPRTKPSRYRSWAHSIFFTNMALVLLACVALQPVTAANVPFENCLPDSYRYNQPTLLQWLPSEVHASFDTENPSHTLLVTMWGNVTGSLYNVTLPPPNSTAWKDPKKIDGKILGEPEPDSDAPKLTTLHSKVEFLTYEPWSDNTNFCNTSLTNATCPLAPIFNTSEMYVSALSRRKCQADS